MSKCKYVNCDKEVNVGDSFCKHHQSKIERIKKGAFHVVSGAGALAFTFILKKKPPTK